MNDAIAVAISDGSASVDVDDDVNDVDVDDDVNDADVDVDDEIWVVNIKAKNLHFTFLGSSIVIYFCDAITQSL